MSGFVKAGDGRELSATTRTSILDLGNFEVGCSVRCARSYSVGSFAFGYAHQSHTGGFGHYSETRYNHHATSQTYFGSSTGARSTRTVGASNR